MKRVGIVGAGLTGGMHAERWAILRQTQDRLLSDRRDRLELAGFFTRTPERAQAAAIAFGGRAFPSLKALLAEVDVVDVCTPTPSHKDVVLASAAAGKDVICEKPMARHLRDAEEMIAACEAAGVRLFVAHVVRFFPEYVCAKEILNSGQLGRPGVIRTVRGGACLCAGTYFQRRAGRRSRVAHGALPERRYRPPGGQLGLPAGQFPHPA